MVRSMAGFRMPQDEIAQVILNPKTHKPISERTLINHFKDELQQGYSQLKMRIYAASVRSAIGDKDHPGNVTAQIWLQKTLYGARETTEFGLPGAPGAAFVDTNAETTMLDDARRVAFLMASGARVAKKTKVPA